MNRILQQIPCTRYKLKKAGYLILLGRYQEAQNITNDILHADEKNADAIYVHGMSFYYQENMVKAFCHFERVLRLVPNHQKATAIYKRAKALVQRKEEGNKAYKAGRLEEAYSLYTEALRIDPRNKSINAKLFYNRAMVCSRLGRFDEAVTDCSIALQLDKNYRKALLQRAKCFMELRDFDKAVNDYESAFKTVKSPESKRLLEDAKLALERSKRKDYYKILGVDKNASTNQIKTAFRRKALAHHPDRHVTACVAERREQEEKFKEVGQAYEILSDLEKRKRYDMSLCNWRYGRQ
jgi:DnaJ family protein C protein 7